MRKKNSNQIFFGGLYDVLFILDENVMFSLCPRYEKNKIVKVNKMFAQIQTKWTWALFIKGAISIHIDTFYELKTFACGLAQQRPTYTILFAEIYPGYELLRRY